MRILSFIIFFLPLFCLTQGNVDVTDYPENGLYGIKDANGKKITEAIYDKKPYFDKINRVCHVSKDEKQGLISFDGKEIAPAIYSEIAFFSEENGLCAVTKDLKSGFINVSGKIVIPLIYDEVDWFFQNGICRAMLNDKYGLINEQGGIVTPLEYDEISFLAEESELFPVRQGDFWGYMDFSGKLRIPIMYEIALDFKGEKALVFTNEQFYYITKSNAKTSNSYYFKAQLSTDLYILRNDVATEFYLFDETMDDIRSEVFQAVYAFSEEMASVKQNGKFGFINDAGVVVIPCKFDHAQPFINGKAEVILSGETFEIDKMGLKIK